jgi:hypothetical protein
VRRRRRRGTRGRARGFAAGAAVLAALLLVPAVASANAYHDVLQSYGKKGEVVPCRFSSATLEAALGEAGPNSEQYFGDFTNAVQYALAVQATGICNQRHGHKGAQPAPFGGPVSAPRPPASATSPTDSGIPAPLAILAGLAGAFVLLELGIWLARARGWDPRWAAPARHSWGEAEFRLGGGWDTLRDRLRLRRV